MKLELHAVELQDFKGLGGGPYVVPLKNPSFLSGPNGYGKTTIFEAIELCMTGEVARIEESIRQRRENGNVAHKTSPLHNNGSKPFVIKLHVAKGHEARIIEVSKSPGKTPLADYNKNLALKWYDPSSKDAAAETVTRQAISDWLGFGDAPGSIYKLFVYVSQEDNTFFLRQRQTDRHALLANTLTPA